MVYSGYQMLWFLLTYSFLGWIGEVAAAVVKQHRFVNRGFVTGPMCPIYGVGAMAFALFLPELRDTWIFLFLGGMIVASFIEYMTGMGLHRLTGHKWWDYSRSRFHLNGYICLPCSLLWGGCAVFAMKLGNLLICSLVSLIPKPLGWIIVWSLTGTLAADFLGSMIAVLGWRKIERIIQLKQELGKTSRLLENVVTRNVRKRMVRAFPQIRESALETTSVFGCSLYELTLLFFIASFLGALVETVFMWLTTGKLVSRSGVVYGQFSLIWGAACVLATLLLYQFRNRSDSVIFLWGTMLGGAYEYICSVLSELIFGAVFWNYSKLPFNLGGRINLLFCFFWGFACVIWIKWLYPGLKFLIARIPKRLGVWVCYGLVIFMVVDLAVSSAAMMRYSARNDGIEPSNALEELIDERFPDSRMKKIYPYMRFR